MENPSEIPAPNDRRSLAVRAAAIGLCALAVLLATSPGLPIVWDEGNAIDRAERIADWTRSWFQQGPPNDNHPAPHVASLSGAEPKNHKKNLRHPLSREAISAGWPYTTQVEGHPAFYGIVIAAGHSIGSLILPPLTAWRMGPIVLFALAVGAMFYRMSRLYGQPAGWAAASALLLQPRLFAHAHFATCDGPLTACWILAWAAFAHTNPKPHLAWLSRAEPKNDKKTLHLRFGLAALLFGVLLGMTMSTKATGWIAPIPFILWAALYRDRRAALTLALGLPIALATFYLLNPPLWHEPGRGLVTFFQLNTNRQLNVATFFLGRMYDLHHSLPWYNTLVWTAVAVPIGLLLLAVVGLASILRHALADRTGILLILNWVILLVVRALPGTPPHDGIRLFLPAFAFLAAIIGVGTVVGVQAVGVQAVGVQALACRAKTLLALLRCHLHPASTDTETTTTTSDTAGTAVGVQALACRAKTLLALLRCHLRPAIADTEKTTTTSDTASMCATACSPSSAERILQISILLIFLGSATSLFCYAPQWLSYYSLAIGGLPGATRAGMEPTYYWDSLDREVLDWLAANTAENEKVLFGSGSVESLALMRSWGTLPVEHRPDAPGRYRWYVIQRRPSACMPSDQRLLQNAQPVYKKYLPSYGPGPWHMNVPLLEVYRYDDYAAAVASSESSP